MRIASNAFQGLAGMGLRTADLSLAVGCVVWGVVTAALIALQSKALSLET